MANKVEFGISNLYVGTYTVGTTGTVTMGTPYHQAGAVSFSPEEQSESNNFYADNVIYYSGYTGGTFEGDLEVAKFDDAFKTQFLGYIQKASDGGLAVVKNATKPKVYIAFQVEGDVESRRIIMYNCALGGITREYNTEEDSIEPATETIAVTVAGDNNMGISMVSYGQTSSGYSTLFTNPPAPTTT
jgi:phi13 family phage major tail protein